MTKPAYLVEGDLEQKFIQSTCIGCVVRKINLNGENVSIQAIAKRVGTLGRLLHKRSSPIIVVFDRENRKESVEEIEDLFNKCISSENIDVPIILGIPDRNLENWILSDYDMISEQFPDFKVTGDLSGYEGKNGKAIIKKLFGSEKYIETIHGVQLLKSTRSSIIYKNSQSFSRFYSALNVRCQWLQQSSLPVTCKL